MVGSLKEQQVHSHKRTKYLSWETLVGEKTQQKLLSIELNQNSVKPKTTAFIFFSTKFLNDFVQISVGRGNLFSYEFNTSTAQTCASSAKGIPHNQALLSNG